MIQLELSKIKIDESRNEQLIVFREKDGTRFLPVVIGLAEVNSIKLKLSGVMPPRPLTHDLMLQMIEALGGKLESVVIDRLQNNTFYAKLMIRRGNETVSELDARPSDSVALALRAGAPVFVTEEILGQAGVTEI